MLIVFDSKFIAITYASYNGKNACIAKILNQQAINIDHMKRIHDSVKKFYARLSH